MKNKYILLLLTVLMVGCAGDKKKSEVFRVNNPKDSVAISASYDSIINIEQKARRDSNYRKTESYRYAQENYHRAIAEHTKGLSHIDQLLYEYEIAICHLNQAGKYAQAHPDQMKSLYMQNLMKIRGEEVLKSYDRLAHLQLSSAQQQRFKELNHIKN